MTEKEYLDIHTERYIINSKVEIIQKYGQIYKTYSQKDRHKSTDTHIDWQIYTNKDCKYVLIYQYRKKHDMVFNLLTEMKLSGLKS